MAEESDVIRHQIDETRESLTNKLESLEVQVKDAVGSVTDTIETVKSTVENTVQSVKSGVEDTVENVKASFNDTVDSVKETFDISRQVDRHPWASLGCSLVAGMAAGYLFAGERKPTYANGIPGMNAIIPGYEPARPIEAPSREPAQPGILSTLLGSFEGEYDKIKRTAIGLMISVARDAIKDALPPSLSESVTEIMNDVARRAGGEPITGPVLRSEPADQQGVA
jgi:ElaB/YqjD/DUF883 family membrane-anchored ribosome-binding protein